MLPRLLRRLEILEAMTAQFNEVYDPANVASSWSASKQASARSNAIENEVAPLLGCQLRLLSLSTNGTSRRSSRAFKEPLPEFRFRAEIVKEESGDQTSSASSLDAESAAHGSVVRIIGVASRCGSYEVKFFLQESQLQEMLRKRNVAQPPPAQRSFVNEGTGNGVEKSRHLSTLTEQLDAMGFATSPPDLPSLSKSWYLTLLPKFVLFRPRKNGRDYYDEPMDADVEQVVSTEEYMLLLFGVASDDIAIVPLQQGSHTEQAPISMTGSSMTIRCTGATSQGHGAVNIRIQRKSKATFFDKESADGHSTTDGIAEIVLTSTIDDKFQCRQQEFFGRSMCALFYVPRVAGSYCFEYTAAARINDASSVTEIKSHCNTSFLPGVPCLPTSTHCIDRIPGRWAMSSPQSSKPRRDAMEETVQSAASPNSHDTDDKSDIRVGQHTLVRHYIAENLFVSFLIVCADGNRSGTTTPRRFGKCGDEDAP